MKPWEKAGVSRSTYYRRNRIKRETNGASTDNLTQVESNRILTKQMMVVLEQDQPLSVRHVFYRMVDPTLDVVVPKTHNGYRRVQRLLANMRLDGRIPLSLIHI